MSAPLTEHRNGSVVRFTVTDTGIGIRENFLDQIFEPSEQEDSTATMTFGGTGSEFTMDLPAHFQKK